MYVCRVYIHSSAFALTTVSVWLFGVLFLYYFVDLQAGTSDFAWPTATKNIVTARFSG